MSTNKSVYNEKFCAVALTETIRSYKIRSVVEHNDRNSRGDPKEKLAMQISLLGVAEKIIAKY